MKIHKKTDLPARDGKEEFSLTVLTCDKRGITNLGYYNFDTEDWAFLWMIILSTKILILYGSIHRKNR